MKKKFVFALWLFVIGFTVAIADDFQLNDINGKLHKLSDYKGKWVIVNYWATWCPPCLDEMPELVDFHEAHKNKDAVVLGFNYEDVDLNYLKQFVSEYLISYPILIAEPGKDEYWGAVSGLPMTIIISPEGKMVKRRIGRVNVEYLEDAIGYKKHVVNAEK